MKAEYIILSLAVVATLFVSQLSPARNPIHQEFKKFKDDFNRDYTPEEELYRFKIFSENFVKIETHNSDPTQTYQMGVNQFADMTREEFIEQILVKDLANMEMSGRMPVINEPNPTYPEVVDWRVFGVVTPIKNQQRCGSCWAFSTTGTLESVWAVAKGELNNFSEQQLVDCCGAKGYQCQGCNGAWPEWALNYINSAGIVQQNEYSYTAVQGSCKATPTAKKYLNSATPWAMVKGSDNIKETLGKKGPISICIDASNWSLYKSGVFSNCGTTVLNHAVLAVGYNEDGTWIVKNSWGTSWGVNGYITLAAGNTCGLEEHVIVPNVV